MESNDPIKYLWTAKLKSRNSFLLVLEFLQVPRKLFKSVLCSLRPDSPAFYDTYVAGSWQFTPHDLYATEKITLSMSGSEMLKEVGW